jgi:outer membrane lipoprotein-sorting protein
MKPRHSLIPLLAIVLLSVAALPQPSSETSSELEKVLDQMDKAAAAFHTTEASFEWDQYQKVVEETDIQKGKVYFRRSGEETQMAADISEPDKKYVLFADSKVQIYQPRIDQITVYNAGKNRAEFESFLVLGFGGRGHDLSKSFEVKYLGAETVAGIEASKLELVPKAVKVRNTFAKIVLWIDPARGVSIQQQLFEPSGDYRLSKFSSIEINQKISDSVFRIKTTPKTKTVSPQG